MDLSRSRRWPTGRPAVGDAGGIVTWRRCHLVDCDQSFTYWAGGGDFLLQASPIGVEIKHFCDADIWGVSDTDQTIGIRRDKSRLILESKYDLAAGHLPMQPLLPSDPTALFVNLFALTTTKNTTFRLYSAARPELGNYLSSFILFVILHIFGHVACRRAAPSAALSRLSRFPV